MKYKGNVFKDIYLFSSVYAASLFNEADVGRA
jgi:hypothetical protein